MRRHSAKVLDFPVELDWKDDDFLARLGGEDDPLDAAILAALILDNPVKALRRYERAARLNGREADADYWCQAQQWLFEITRPDN